MVEPGRADAQRNRGQLLAAARDALLASGEKVTLDAIARAAGVGIGTLYRHFPTREALVDAVYRTERVMLCESAAVLLARHPPDVALRAWMDGFGDYVALKYEMADTLRAVIASKAASSAAAREELGQAVRGLLAAGATAGTLRDDVAADDVLAGLLGVFLVCRGPARRDQAGRLLDLLMSGLRADR